MRKITIPAKGAGMAMMAAGGLMVGAAIAFHPAPSADATINHLVMDLDAHSPVQQAAAPANAVVINDFTFGPATLTVAAGTKVVWTNDDADPHTVVSETDPKLFKSPPLDTGETFAFTFDKPGTYRYFCSVHPHMQGTVVVQ
jgi:plastocyanin